MGIYFYSADTKNTSIIAYGDTMLKRRHFKIVYKKESYICYRKRCAKFEKIGESKSLDDAKILCTNN